MLPKFFCVKREIWGWEEKPINHPLKVPLIPQIGLRDFALTIQQSDHLTIIALDDNFSETTIDGQQDNLVDRTSLHSGKIDKPHKLPRGSGD
jgi:hypothetical protein